MSILLLSQSRFVLNPVELNVLVTNVTKISINRVIVAHLWHSRYDYDLTASLVFCTRNVFKAVLVFIVITGKCDPLLNWCVLTPTVT